MPYIFSPLALTAHWSGLAALVLVTLTLNGCAGLAPAVEEPGEAKPVEAGLAEKPSVASVAVPPASTGFEPGTLFRLLSAEFGIRRGESAMAVKNYLDIAKETRDAGVAERATRMAVYARDERSGLEASQLWMRLADTLDAHRVHSALLVRAGKIDPAIKELLVIVRRFGDGKGKGYDIVADVLSRERNKERRVELMEKIVAHDADNLRARSALAQVAARSGQVDKATRLLADIHAAEPDNSRYGAFYASLLRSQGKVEEALEILSSQLAKRSEATQADADGQELRLVYARFLVDAKRYEQARTEFEWLTIAAPERADVRYALGLLLLQTNHHEEAREHFTKLVSLRERLLEANFYLGQIAEAQDDDEVAIRHYRRVDRAEQYIDAQVRVAAIYAKTDRMDRARQHLGAVRRGSERDDIRLYRAEAELLARHERFDDAITVYDGALLSHPQNTDLLYSRAMMASRVDKFDILERDLRAILSREPNNADALNALGYTLADRDLRLEEAHDLIRRALVLKPKDHYIIDSLGWVLYRMGRLEEAVQQLRKAMELRPDAEVAAHLGEVLWVSGRQAEARQIWDTALETTPEDKRLLETIDRLSK
jgi:tetratricopeptide (TPR) repeat protein